MNIFGLFEKLGLHQDNAIRYTPEQVIRIEKKINAEKRLDPEIDVNLAANLVEAIRNYSPALYFFTNHRQLYNFFAGTDYGRDYFKPVLFEISDEELQGFTERFFAEDLLLFFEQRLSQNQYDQINDMLLFGQYFPESVLFKVSRKAVAKIETALGHLHRDPKNSDEFDHIRRKAFYDFLSYFSSIEMDEKLKLLLNFGVDQYNNNKQSPFYGSLMLAMSDYEAFDDDFRDTLQQNRRVVNSNKNGTSSSGGWNVNWRVFAFVIFFLVKMAFFTKSCNADRPSYDNIKYNPGIVRLDSLLVNKQDKEKFLDYLTETDSVSEVLRTKNTATGQNPFSNVYNGAQSNAKAVCVRNNSAYDVIVLQNSGGMADAQNTAYFIKQGDSLRVSSEGSFHFYFGEKLASFKTKDTAAFYKEPRPQEQTSRPENRFLQQIKDNQRLLSKEFIIQKDVVLSGTKKEIRIYSPFLYCNDDPSQKSKDTYIFR